jgi:hypothetical protein
MTIVLTQWPPGSVTRVWRDAPLFFPKVLTGHPDGAAGQPASFARNTSATPPERPD